MTDAHSSDSHRESKQSGKKSYADPVKAKSRDALEKFVRTHLSFKKPKKLDVLCFPGAEQDGEAGLELAVYDRLGIPRKNITGLECDPERAERLRRANLGIDVVCAYDSDFLRDAVKSGRRWDVLSLDYCSFFSQGRYETVRLIAGKGLLKDTGVLCTNYMGRRENMRAQNLLCGFDKQARVARDTSLLDDILQSRDVTRVMDLILEKQGEVGERPFTEARSSSIPSTVIMLFVNGSRNFPYSAVRSAPWGDVFLEYTREHVERLADDSREQLRELVAQGAAVNEVEAYLRRTKEGMTKVDEFAMGVLGGSGLPPQLHLLLSHVIWKAYSPRAHESYRYVSNSGTPMMFDLFFFDGYARELKRQEELLRYDPQRGVYLFAPDIRSNEAQARKLSRALAFSDRLDVQNTQAIRSVEETPRVDLGSSYVREKGKGKLSRDEAIGLLEGGVPISEILDAYDGFSDHQLRAFKAHIRMGTYEEEFE